MATTANKTTAHDEPMPEEAQIETVDEQYADADAEQEKEHKPVAEMNSKELAAFKNSLRGRADRNVLAKHRDEVIAEAERLFKENGLEYTRRLTAEEKAEQDLQKLIDENPHLEAVLRAKFSPADAAAE